MKGIIKSALYLAVAVVALVATPAFAGPGGFIAKAAFDTVWGRVALTILTLLFLPLIIYVLVREKKAERRARMDLRFMAAYDPNFQWLQIQQRAKDCFYRVHSGWDDEDLSAVSGWMTDWYWQNQQLVHLRRWKRDGLKNICKVRKITGIRPLLFLHRNEHDEHDGSMLVIAIKACMKDYLVRRDTGKVVEGNKRDKDVETVWTFILRDDVWKVSDIEDGVCALSYAGMIRDLPAIETTVRAPEAGR